MQEHDAPAMAVADRIVGDDASALAAADLAVDDARAADRVAGDDFVRKSGRGGTEQRVR